MLNHNVLVGRVAGEMKQIDEKTSELRIAIPRSYKNEEGIYETDIIPVILTNMLSKNASEYLKQGDMVGVKGRLENQDNKVVVVAEKLTFLSSNKTEETNEEN